MKKNSILLLVSLFMISPLFSQVDTISVNSTHKNQSDSLQKLETTQRFSYIPRIFSIIKTDYEWNTQKGTQRFLVRNARLGVKSDINPYIHYQMEVDLSSEGAFRVLNAFTVFTPYKDEQHSLKLWMGYQKPFFSSEYLRNPMKIFFIRPSLVVSEMTAGIADVGVIADYAFDNSLLPFNLGLGVFNGMGVKNQYFTSPNYNGRIRIYPYEGFSFTAQYYGGHNIDSNKLNMLGMEAAYQNKSFFAEIAYFHRNIKDKLLHSSDINSSIMFQTYYRFPLKNIKHLHYIAPTIRWDMLGSKYFIDNISFARLTAGVNFGLDHRYFKAEFRLNYEKFIQSTLPIHEDMFIAEFIISI
ncbi:MAG: hypothetical protein WC142_03330 [Bacteroidales bacterium]|jgi:hypothetical protein|nr:hypothetical protein [Bacteroidales bacterium]MDD2688086.1 hypothetical protein [Bacteroidales bacterium]MDD3330305.1 hypothetical protein [Bacteroidales bacterium]MDD3690963.1 hypothetical protein [Bacteroidales bacterium]MDD4044370.1 hypothetical protein [Bacteroidales bacterium]